MKNNKTHTCSVCNRINFSLIWVNFFWSRLYFFCKDRFFFLLRAHLSHSESSFGSVLEEKLEEVAAEVTGVVTDKSDNTGVLSGDGISM